MKDVPWLVLIIYVGNCFVAILLNYYVEAYKHEATLTTLNEAVKVAGINSYDHSLRINEGEVLISTKVFEHKIKTLFEKNISVAIEKDTLDMTFDYLIDNDVETDSGTENKIKAIKAVRVKVSYNKDKPYEMTYVTNVVK